MIFGSLTLVFFVGFMAAVLGASELLITWACRLTLWILERRADRRSNAL